MEERLSVSSLLKKFNPNISIIFSGPAFKDTEALELVPEGLVDIFIVDREQRTLLRILEGDSGEMGDIANIISYKNGTYQCNIRQRYDEKAEFTVDFERFDLSKYNNLRLPLRWTYGE
jgi:hypothetical protein